MNQTLKQNGMTKQGMTRVAFCFDSLNMNQAVYTCVHNTNRWLEQNFGTDFSLFGQEPLIPDIQPLFARYYIEDVSQFQGILICCSIDSIIRSRCATMTKKFFYIQDIYESRDFNTKRSEFIDIMNDNSIVKFARSEDIKNHYKNFGFQILDKVVENFNIKEILEIVNG